MRFQPVSRLQQFLMITLVMMMLPAAAEEPRSETKPLEIASFTINEHQAFVIVPAKASSSERIPWVWYAPTLFPRYPGSQEEWMFNRFHDAGIAVAGIDVGESYGSPKGRAIYQAFYEELTKQRGFHGKPVLLARSRGGLMLYNWAVEHPESVGGIAGIYPVCNLVSYPGISKAAPAYGMSADEFEAKLAEHNPVDRLSPLAKAKVPIHHLQGDSDRVVPLEANSAELAKRYQALGGPVEVEVIKGQGHNLWRGWFHSTSLTDFVVARALAVSNAEQSEGVPGQSPGPKNRSSAADKPVKVDILSAENGNSQPNAKTTERRETRQSEENTGTTPARPNVLFIVCDDLNTHVSTSGYQPIETPAFEQLAAAGMTFQRAYCQYPVCGPSRASFLSGLYPESTGVLDNKTDIRQARPGTASMPQAFKKSGYWTASVGKVFHNPTIDPGEVAWNEVLRFENDEMPHVTAARKKFEAEHGSVERGKTRRLWREHLHTLSTQTRGQQQPGYGPSGLRDEQHKDGKNVRQVVSWLNSKTYGDKPFFIACGIQKPHVPFLAPDAYFAKYPKESLRFTLTPPDFWNQAPRSAMVKRFEGFGFELGVENDDLRREYTQAYHACISFIDAQIGQVFEALRMNGHWEDTIVVLTSDHGYQLGEHFMWGKVTLFEVCDRVPLMIRVPGMTQPGSSSNGLVELVDIFPTLAELCSVPSPNGLHGRSIVPMLRDASTPGKRAAYTVVTRGPQLGRAVRTDRWRYARWADGEELYDLQTDPHEHVNLASSDTHRETLEQMRSELNRMESIAGSQRERKASRR